MIATAELDEQIADQRFATSGSWALASDGIQWVLQRQRRKNGGAAWRPVSFVRSTKEVLARRMREKGVPPDDAARLLDGLPNCFAECTAEPLRAGLSALATADKNKPGPDQSADGPERKAA